MYPRALSVVSLPSCSIKVCKLHGQYSRTIYHLRTSAGFSTSLPSSYFHTIGSSSISWYHGKKPLNPSSSSTLQYTSISVIQFRCLRRRSSLISLHFDLYSVKSSRNSSFYIEYLITFSTPLATFRSLFLLIILIATR